MGKSWLWNIRKPEKEIREILKNPLNEKFVHYAALLLSRSNNPAEVFNHYISKETFVRYWNQIKRRMRKNKWDQDRILFWQEIYRYWKKELKMAGPDLGRTKEGAPVSLRKDVGQSIKGLRISKGMTQQELAKKAGIHQQVISKIEKGTANPSLKTIEKITKHLSGSAGIKIVSSPPDQLTTTYQSLGKRRSFLGGKSIL